MLTWALLALAVCGDSSTKVAEQESPRYAIVSDALVEELGDFRMGIAVDFRTANLERLRAIIPDELGCLRDLFETSRVGVVTIAGEDVEGHFVGFDETRTCACLGKLAPAFGFEFAHVDSAYRLGVPNHPFELAWQGNELAFARAGRPHRKGEPPPVIRNLLSRIPRSAKMWIVSTEVPQQKLASFVLYADVTAETFTITATAEGSESGAARPWIEGVLRGIRQASALKNILLEDSWFVIESTPMDAKVVATIPLSVFERR